MSFAPIMRIVMITGQITQKVTSDQYGNSKQSTINDNSDIVRDHYSASEFWSLNHPSPSGKYYWHNSARNFNEYGMLLN